MAQTWKKHTLVAAVAALGFLAVACGTRGDNLPDNNANTGTSSTGAGTATGTGTSNASQLTGGANGNAQVNLNFPATDVTLTRSDMLPTGASGDATNSPTRLLRANVGALGERTVVIQGNQLGPGNGRIVALPRNPDTTPGSSNVRITPIGGTPFDISNPFAVAANGSGLLVTDGVGLTLQGRLISVSNIDANGQGTFATVGPTNMQNPIDVVTDNEFAYVAEFASAGGGGQIRRVRLDGTNPTGDVLITNLSFPSGLAVDQSNGRRWLYIVENGPGAASGANGGVIRLDLTTFPRGLAQDASLPSGPGTSPTVTDPTSSVAGVTFIRPVETTPDAIYLSPWDIAIDENGNAVITEGVNARTSFTTPDYLNPQGKIRVIASGGNTSRQVLSGLTGTRGPSLVSEGAEAGTVFFTDGASLATNVHQLTFRYSDGAIFRHTRVDNGLPNALDTLFDAGDGTNTIPPNLKYTVNWTGGNQGRVLDLR